MGTAVSLEYNGHKTMFEDFTEQGFTNAIIKVTREKNKTIYFVTEPWRSATSTARNRPI